MKRFNFVPLCLLVCSMPAMSSDIKPSAVTPSTIPSNQMTTSIQTTSSTSSSLKPNFNASDLLGKWHCLHQLLEPKTKIKVDFDYKINFDKNGKSAGKGNLLLSLQGMPGFKYNISDVSTWSLKDKTLTMTSNEMTFKNISHPQFDQLLNLQALFPKKVNESATILVLNKTTLKVDTKSSSSHITCSRL